MNFFDKFLGNWITKKNIFILEYNFKYTYEEKIKIVKHEDRELKNSYQLSYQKDYFNLICLSDFVERKKKILIETYHIKKINKNLLKISRNLDKDIFYTEYIYFINNNFNVSIGFIKRQNYYLATVFTSYIKIYNK